MTGRLQILEWSRILYYCILCYYILRRDQRKCNIEKCNNGDLLHFLFITIRVTTVTPVVCLIIS